MKFVMPVNTFDDGCFERLVLLDLDYKTTKQLLGQMHEFSQRTDNAYNIEYPAQFSTIFNYEEDFCDKYKISSETDNLTPVPDDLKFLRSCLWAWNSKAWTWMVQDSTSMGNGNILPKKCSRSISLGKSWSECLRKCLSTRGTR